MMYNVYFGHFFIRQSDSNIAHKIDDKLSYSFLKLEERYIRFVNNVTVGLLFRLVHLGCTRW